MNGIQGVITAAFVGAALVLAACTVAELPPRADGGPAGDDTAANGDTVGADTAGADVAGADIAAEDPGAEAAGADVAVPDTDTAALDTTAPDADTDTDADTDAAAPDADHAHDADADHPHDVEPDAAADSDAATADPDLDLDWTCTTGTAAPPACTAPVVANIPSKGAAHVSPPKPLTYDDTPPSSGDHRPTWAKWGEYTYCPPQRWVHNLEHGGAVFLYDPCADPTLVAALRSFAQARADDAGGPFRWVLTPYPGLGDMVAVVTWEWSWVSPCVDEAAIEQFLAAHYRMSPEDEAADGGYDTMWLSK